MRAREKGIDFEYDAPADLPAGVCSDEKRPLQVLINLLGNAVKFIESGRVTLRVSEIDDLQSNMDDRERKRINRQSSIVHLQFQIEDTGVGIDPDQLERMRRSCP